MLAHIVVAAILCSLVAGGLAWLVWVGRGWWLKHMAQQRDRAAVRRSLKWRQQRCEIDWDGWDRTRAK